MHRKVRISSCIFAALIVLLWNYAVNHVITAIIELQELFLYEGKHL